MASPEADSGTTASVSHSDVPTTSADVQPVAVGERAPNALLRDKDGNSIALEDVYTSAPTVLIFYRGGWCPYCNTHLGKLATIEDELKNAGYQVVAISPDAPESLRSTHDKTAGKVQLLSDSKAAAAKAFGLAFRFPEETVSMYTDKYKIDLEKSAGGETHHILPAPAAFLIGQDGVIRYRFYSPDYRKRVDEKELLQEAQRSNR